MEPEEKAEHKFSGQKLMDLNNQHDTKRGDSESGAHNVTSTRRKRQNGQVQAQLCALPVSDHKRESLDL